MPSAQTYHQVHLALLGLIILFSLLGWTISAGFVNKNYYIHRTAEGLEVAANLLMFLAALAFLVFSFTNIGRPGSAIKSVWVELLVLGLLWIVVVSAAGTLSDDLDQTDCGDGFANCDLGRAAAAFTWLTWIAVGSDAVPYNLEREHSGSCLNAMIGLEKAMMRQGIRIRPRT
ncbi:hypothetical protein FFLO_01193 [Filobasidium floriforme]|uniref:MARVEL domain-containing protein n=1 Tax=Filobasidium floriforme TaxID=5210 RepID=A0A8K0JRN7_9TREE|nr:hypothetical protein FFLO_01193 [Filobasidium floriforme]